MRSYLREYRDPEYEGPSADQRRESPVETVGRLRFRTTSVPRSNLRQPRDADGVALGDFRLLVSVTVICEDCGQQYGVAELLDLGGRGCDWDSQ